MMQRYASTQLSSLNAVKHEPVHRCPAAAWLRRQYVYTNETFRTKVVFERTLSHKSTLQVEMQTAMERPAGEGALPLAVQKLDHSEGDSSAEGTKGTASRPSGGDATPGLSEKSRKPGTQ